MAYNSTETRELTPSEHLSQAAANLAGSSDQLSQASTILYASREAMAHAEQAQTDAQADFEDKLSKFRQILDQYGLTMVIPETATIRMPR